MPVTADSVVVEIIAKVAKYDADVSASSANFEKSMAAQERAAVKAEATTAAASQRKAAAEERAQSRIADAAERARNREIQAAKRAADAIDEQKRREARSSEIAATRASDALQRSLNRSANGSRNLGRQIADVGSSLASGSSPFLILAQQAPQVADALADTGGKAAAFARFFAGPWGAALLAAGSVAGVLASKIDLTGNSLDNEIDKLKENATKTDLAALAKRAFALTEQSLLGDVAALTAELKKQNDELKTNSERQNIRAKNDLGGLQKRVPELQDKLKQAQQDLLAARATAGADPTGGQIIVDAMKRVAAAQKAIDKLNQGIAAAQAAVQSTRANLADESAQRSLDAVSAINREYDGPNGLIQRAKDRAKAEGVVTGELTKQLRALRARQKERVEAAQKAESDAKKTPDNNQIGRRINVAEATRIAESIGGRVTSGARSRATQERLYADKLAGRHNGPVAKPGTSDHETGNAIDIAYGPGISIASIKAAFRRQGVAIKQLLDEPTQRVFHVAFNGTGKTASQAKVAQDRAIRDDEAFENEKEALTTQILTALRTRAVTASELADFERAAAQSDFNKRKNGISADVATGKYDPKQAQILNDLNEQSRLLRLRNIAIGEDIAVVEEQNSKTQAGLAAQEDEANFALQLAETNAERRQIELELIDIKRQERDAAINAALAQAQIAGDLQKVAELQNQLTLSGRQADVESTVSQRNNEGPISRYRRGLNDPTAQVEQAVADKLQAIDDGITGAIAKKLGIKDPFLRQLLQTFLQQNVLKPIYDAFADAQGGGSGGGGVLGSIISAGAAIFGRASGGYVGAGDLVRVNEGASPGRVEGFRPMGSGHIIPLGQMKAATPPGRTTVVHAPQFNLKGAILTRELYADMQRISQNSAAVAGKVSYQQSIADAPGAVSRRQTLKD